MVRWFIHIKCRSGCMFMLNVHPYMRGNANWPLLREDGQEDVRGRRRFFACNILFFGARSPTKKGKKEKKEDPTS